MNYKKQHSCVCISSNEIREEFEITLSFGHGITGYGYVESPEEWHDTEEEAIQAAIKRNKYCNYILLTKIIPDRN